MSAIANPVVDVPRQLLLELAIGLESFDDICAKYEYTASMAEALKSHSGVMARVQRLAAELRNDGVTFRIRAAYAAEDLIGDIWTEAKSKDTPLSGKLAAAQFLAKMGDLEPKPSAANGAGQKFSITITTGERASSVIDVTPVLPSPPVDSHRASPRASSVNSDLALPSELDFSVFACV